MSGVYLGVEFPLLQVEHPCIQPARQLPDIQPPPQFGSFTVSRVSPSISEGLDEAARPDLVLTSPLRSISFLSRVRSLMVLVLSVSGSDSIGRSHVGLT